MSTDQPVHVGMPFEPLAAPTAAASATASNRVNRAQTGPGAPAGATQPIGNRIPGADGKMYTAAQFQNKRFGTEWQVAMAERAVARERNPYYSFLVDLEGLTSPLFTMQDLDTCYDGDIRKHNEEIRKRETDLATSIVKSKAALYTQMISSTAQDQLLRLKTQANPLTGRPEVVVDTDVPAAANMRDDTHNMLAQQRMGQRHPMSLQQWMHNIDTSINQSLQTVPSFPVLDSDASTLDWASHSETAMIVRYSSVVKSAMKTVAGLLWSIAQFRIKPEDIPTLQDQEKKFLITQMVAVQIKKTKASIPGPRGKEPPLVKLEDLESQAATLMFGFNRLIGNPLPYVRKSTFY